MNDIVNAGIDQLKTEAINTAGMLLTSPLPHQFWTDVKYFVRLQENMGGKLTGPQKHEAVKAQLKLIFEKDLGPILLAFGETFIDVAIKVGVLYLTSQNPIAGAVAGEVVNAVLVERRKQP